MINTERIFGIQNDQEFEKLAVEIFLFQYKSIEVYRQFIDYLKVDPKSVTDISKIPFLPIEFFKSHKIISAGSEPQIIFESSGTTGNIPSRHFVTDTGLYEKSLIRGFKQFYGNPEDFCILALLPSYVERSTSSLVYMTEKLISFSRDADSGFYLEDFRKLVNLLVRKNSSNIRTILLGVSFALADLAYAFPTDLQNIIIMETGGMKGRRKEMVREELHNLLEESFKVNAVHSEYGMTEILSQAYSHENGIFKCPPWLKIIVRDSHDPLQILSEGTGAINIIDLANINSCSFIATSDLGKLYPDGSFEVLGRMDISDIRGCNLMVV